MRSEVSERAWLSKIMSLPVALHDAISVENPHVPDGALKRFLLMLNNRIFDSKVDRAIPSLAAAPDGPNIRP